MGRKQKSFIQLVIYTIQSWLHKTFRKGPHNIGKRRIDKFFDFRHAETEILHTIKKHQKKQAKTATCIEDEDSDIIELTEDDYIDDNIYK